jgi:sugar transferase EpsL
MRPYAILKRGFDIAVAATVTAVAAPVLAAAAIAVRATMGSPVLFRQQRPGLHGSPFELLKLRTMTDATDEARPWITDGTRLTRLGKFLRTTSIDELPQLWNVLKGDMSLVGPRPLMTHYLERYTPRQARRHEVLPGVTGWTQVHGRNALSWDEKFDLDLWYVDHASMLVDLHILGLTALRVLRPQGVSSAGHATMPEFMGSAAVTSGRARVTNGQAHAPS